MRRSGGGGSGDSPRKTQGASGITLHLAVELRGRKANIPLSFASSIPIGSASIRGRVRNAVRQEASRLTTTTPSIEDISVFSEDAQKWYRLEDFPGKFHDGMQVYAFQKGDGDKQGWIPPVISTSKAMSPREVNEMRKLPESFVEVRIAGDVGGRRVNFMQTVSSRSDPEAMKIIASTLLREEAAMRYNAEINVQRVLIRSTSGWRDYRSSSDLRSNVQLYALQHAETAPPRLLPTALSPAPPQPELHSACFSPPQPTPLRTLKFNLTSPPSPSLTSPRQSRVLSPRGERVLRDFHSMGVGETPKSPKSPWASKYWREEERVDEKEEKVMEGGVEKGEGEEKKEEVSVEREKEKEKEREGTPSQGSGYRDAVPPPSLQDAEEASEGTSVFPP